MKTQAIFRLSGLLVALHEDPLAPRGTFHATLTVLSSKFSTDKTYLEAGSTFSWFSSETGHADTICTVLYRHVHGDQVKY